MGSSMPTLEEWADLPPACDAALVGVLAQRGLQEEQRHATREHEEEVWNEEDTWEQQQKEQRLEQEVREEGNVGFTFNISCLFSSSSSSKCTFSHKNNITQTQTAAVLLWVQSEDQPQCVRQRPTRSIPNKHFLI